MSLETFSSFYYGFTVDQSNLNLPFKEGAPELNAEVNIGAYSLRTFLTAVASALTAIGGQAYTVVVNRTTRIVTISATSNFSLLVASGSTATLSIFALLGFTGADRTGTNSYSGNLPTGFEYLPQFILQDHIAPESWQEAAESTVNKTSTGRVEVVKFGDQSFLQANIRYITDITQDGQVIKTNGTGVADAIAFMNYARSKAPLDFMADVSDKNTFIEVIVELTDDSKDGTGFKLKELYDKGLPGYFETGIIKFRVQNGN